MATAMAVSARFPAATALPKATLSAQIVNPYDAFSMLQPTWIVPDSVKTAAPTRKLE